MRKKTLYSSILFFLLLAPINPAKGVDYETQVDTLIQPLVEQGLLGGVILIAEEGKKVFEKGYGYADRKKKIANTPDTRFRISSITKIFTALAVMQLHEKRELDIQQSIRKYFEDMEAGEKITILHLLTHTSGIPSYNWRRSNNKPGSLSLVYKWIKELPLKFTPGTRFLYSNSGYALLAMIIEKVSDMPYEDYLEKYIFSPLGMTDTGLTWMNKSTKNLAHGYSKSGYAPYQPANRPTPLGRGDGDLYSTPSDLLKLVIAFYTDRIVSEKTRKRMITPHMPEGRCGIGWFVQKNKGETLVYHPGGSLGFIANLRIYQQGNKILINLFNSDFLLFRIVESELEAIVLGKTFLPVLSKEKNKHYLEELKPFLGEYRIDKDETFQLFQKNGHLIFQEKGYPECPVYIYEKNKIYIIQNNYDITFSRDTSGFRFKGMFGLYYVKGQKTETVPDR